MDSIGSVIGRGLLVAGLLIPAGSALAAGGDDGFAALWTPFKASLGKSDQKAVSQMVRYPIYYNDKHRQADDFLVIWNGNFKPAQRTSLGKQRPIKDTSNKDQVTYNASCGEDIYVFGKDGATCKLTDFAVND